MLNEIYSKKIKYYKIIFYNIIYKMSNEIFDIPETEKPKKKKREMTPEAKARKGVR